MAGEARELCQVAEGKQISKISVAGKAVGRAEVKTKKQNIPCSNDEKDQTPETEASEQAVVLLQACVVNSPLGTICTAANSERPAADTTKG